MRTLLLIILLPLMSSVYCDLLELVEDRVFNTSDVDVYNLEVKTASTKFFYSVLRPGESIPAPADNFVVSYIYFSEAEGRYISVKQNFKARKEHIVTPAVLMEEVDSSQSYWYDKDTYVLILVSKQPLTYTILPSVSQAVEGEEEETIKGNSSRVKYVYVVSDLVCLGQTTKFNTKRAVFLLRKTAEKPFYTVLCKVERKGGSRIIRFNIPSGKK